MTIVIMGRNISSWGRKSDLKICPEAETIRPKMTICPLDEQALRATFMESLRPPLSIACPTMAMANL